MKYAAILANIVGHIQGDGCISFRKSHKISKKVYPWLRFNNSCLNLVKRVAEEITGIFPEVSITITERKYPKGNYVLQVTQSEIVNHFISLGADTHEVPEWIKNSPDFVKTSYLRALFDDEGNVFYGTAKSRGYKQVTKSLSLGTNSKKFTLGIYDLLVSLDMRPYLTSGKYKINKGRDFAPYFVIGLRNNDSILKFYKLINFDHPIKKEKLNSIINNTRFKFKE